ncbi:MAG TPA: outer membrane protein assembly factor BamA [Steroidobacteraceae bacterium]|nr:outer membrane protein assembly factor BamA [Steroidobacteraceae bacterium]
MRFRLALAVALALTAGVTLAQSPSAEPGEFTVGDMRVEGLQRISEGTVYNYLPVSLGDRMTHQKVEEAIRALYATGFFRDVELRRDGNTLVVAVRERPSIESFEIKGNKDIKTEDMQKSLKNVGLATGKTFDRSVLEDVKQYLTDQYFSRGKYAVKVDAKVEDVPGNKVKISIDIKEGKRAKIRQINFVGDTAYPPKEILDTLELKTPNWLSWYKQDDRYSRETLQGDLEKLRSWYMDRGYANFQIDSTQVAIAPEKDDIFITVNVTEGDVFRVSEVKLAGTMVVPEEDLRKLILVQPGQIYSRKLATNTQELMSYRLGSAGYAFAKIEPVPTTDPDKKTVSLTFFVDPGNRAYVRRVNFNNTTSINDEVLRREMRQLEGAWLSNQAVDRSKQRLQRLPYIEKVEVENKPVTGTPDLVDVNFDIKEGLPGQFGGGIGYSQAQGIVLNGNFTHANFMGRGERVSVEVNAGRYSSVYSLSETDPYTTIDGVARTLSLTYRKSTQFVSSASQFSTTMLTAGADFSYPITEFQGVHLGASASIDQLLASETGSADEAIAWVRDNGSTYTRTATVLDGTGATTTFDFYGSRFDIFQVVAGWSFDSRNRAIFADRGLRNSVQVSYALPGTSVRYYTAAWNFLDLIPTWKQFVVAVKAQVDYGNKLGNTTALPPFAQFFAGGPDTVRGYYESRLGPKDSFGNPYGGNLLTVANLELLFPTPEKWKANVRVSAFYDIGNVFSTCCVNFVGQDRQTPVNYKFSYNELKRSVGIGVQWLAPLGIFRFSYAVPLNASEGNGITYPDQREGFQFSIGSAF